MTVVVPTTADVLRGIAEEVRRDPSIWTQGCLGRDEYRAALTHPELLGHAVCACSVGLVYMAFGATDWSHGTGQGAADAALCAAIGSGCIASWNDERGRTAEEVADAFERAAGLLDEGLVIA